MTGSRLRFPLSFPAPGAGGRTGAWRTSRPLVNESVCTGCGLCEVFCPTGSVYVERASRVARIDYEYCKGCGLCSNVCPRRAISMVREG